MKKSILNAAIPWIVVLFVLTGCLSYKLADMEPTETILPQKQEEEINENIAKLTDRIKQINNTDKQQIANLYQIQPEEVEQRTETLQEILTYYNRSLQALKKYQGVISEIKQLEEKIQSGEAYKPDKAPPYSLRFYDDFTIKLSDSIRNRETAEQGVKLARNSLELTENRLKDASQSFRMIKSKADIAAEEAKSDTLQLQWRVNRAEREVELNRAIRKFHQISLENARNRLVLAEKKLYIQRQIFNRIREKIYLKKDDLDKQLENIDQRKKELQDNVKNLIREIQKKENQTLKLTKKSKNSSSEKEAALHEQAIEANNLWRRFYQKTLEQNQNLQQFLTFQKQVWKKRYELIRGSYDKKDLSLWKKEVLEHSERMQRSISIEQGFQTSIQLQLAALQERLDQKEINPELREMFIDQKMALKEMADGSFGYLTSVGAINQMYSRFIDEIDTVRGGLTIWDHVSVLLSRLEIMWNFELFVVDEQSITVGKILQAVIILVIGIILSGQITKFFHRRILKKTRMSPSAAAITQKLLFYTFFIIILLFVMQIVNIPLTAFTFLGGALAIGVGFGAQKLFNNLISGFILMAEQPIKVGDLIQINDELGWIDDIGVRSTRVRTFSNINILIPNSFFLENNIINWTHTDNVIRGKVKVGAVYGSPPRKVEELLMKAVNKQKEILKKPDPYVWFTDFSDNALVFELYFWISITALTGRQRIESELRYIIVELFKEEGIVIAFPQRDVHLDSVKPLQVEIVDGNGEK